MLGVLGRRLNTAGARPVPRLVGLVCRSMSAHLLDDGGRIIDPSVDLTDAT